MTTFLVIGFIFIAGWSVMFYSQVYRWQFVQFPFFACITLEAFIVMIASCVLGAVCWRNFDKGLAHYRKHLSLRAPSLPCPLRSVGDMN